MALRIWFLSLVLTPVLIVFNTGCTKKNQVLLLEGGTMGTTYKVKYVPLEPVDPALLQEEIEKILAKVNRQMSTYDKGSEISKVNSRYKLGQELVVSSWFAQVLNFSLGLAQKTQGVYDPTVGPLVNLWGFGPNGKRKVPSKAQVKEVQNYVGSKKVDLSPRQGKWYLKKKHEKVYIDLSSTAKGFAVDKISEHLSLKGIVNHLVDIGGEIRVRGHRSENKPWVLAVEKPVEGSRGIQVHFALQDQSIATSGSYRNFFKQGGKTYSHTIDVQSGRPIKHNLVSVSVLHSSCMEADGWATALMALGPKKAWAMAQKHKLAIYIIFKRSKGSGKGEELKSRMSPEFRRLTRLRGH